MVNEHCRKATVITVCAEKGGVGKTTTAVNLACALAFYEDRKTLLVDLDSQGHVSSCLNSEFSNGTGPTMTEILLSRGRDLFELVHRTRIDGLFVIPSDRGLNETEKILSSKIGKEFILKQAMKKVSDYFDFIIIDCPPSIGNLTLNALVTSDFCIIPSDISCLSMQALSDITGTIETIEERLSHHVKILGILLTRVDRRNIHTNEAVLKDMRRNFRDLMFQTSIPINTAIVNAQIEGRPVFFTSPDSKGALSYRKLSEEILARIDPYYSA
jgi:chromosome partitioning protein